MKIGKIWFIFCLTFFLLSCQKKDDNLNTTSKIDSLHHVIDSLITLHGHDKDTLGTKNNSSIPIQSTPAQDLHGLDIYTFNGRPANETAKSPVTPDPNQEYEWNLIANGGRRSVKWRMEVAKINYSNNIAYCILIPNNYSMGVYVFNTSHLHRDDIIVVTGEASHYTFDPTPDHFEYTEAIRLDATNILVEK